MESSKLLFLLFLFSLVTNNGKAEKYALLIGVGEYPSESGWQKLSSEKDVDYIKTALLNRGFLDKNIQTLLNEATTKKSIENAVNELTQVIRKGDIVYIHFSGHGQQIVDVDGDEIDGLDEALVPYDSPMYYQKGKYEGKKLLLDDEIKVFTNNIRKKLGKKGQLIFVADACHSGTSVRGQVKVRGTSVIMGTEKQNIDMLEQDYGFQDENYKKNSLASMISVFASGANEANFEAEEIGSLSYAMAKALNQQNELSFQELFEHIKLTMASIAPYQHPQLEGDKDLLVFNSKNNTLKPSYSVEEVITPKRIRVNFGLLHDIPVGSMMEVISLGENKAITKGKVVASNLQYSEIKLEKAIPESMEVPLRVKILSKAAPPIYCNLKIDIPNDNDCKKIVEALKAKNIFNEVSFNYDLILSLCEDNGLLELRNKNGDLLCQTNLQKSDFYNTRKFEAKIRAFTQTKYLRQYETQSNLDLSLELIPVQIKEVDGRLVTQQTLSVEDYTSTFGTLQFRVGDAVQMEITNNNPEPAYFSIMDIQPDHTMRLLVPSMDEEQQAADFFIKGNSSIVLPTIFRFDEPYGRDVLKLIATKQPLGLGDILSSDGIIRRNKNNQPIHPFEQLFSYTYQNPQTRGLAAEHVQISNVGVSSLVYEIMK